MGNEPSKIEEKQPEKTMLVEPDNNHTSKPTTYGTAVKTAQEHHDGHGVPHVPPVKGLGFCERILVSTSHRATVLFVGASLGILFLGLDSKFNQRLGSHHHTSKATKVLVPFASYLTCAFLVMGGIFGCLRAHKITWWKALAPGLILQIGLLVYYVHNSRTNVIDGITSGLQVPGNLTDVDSS
mmetsp:Transcript_10274/g.19712  ORF Transcript_10274/g.19712 Transcript_10274/m.19712 type:complete len:183 (+) Transcript_10274:109-657(+)|eukprot:scaffold4420_cov187-Amphora_coffeaeformis.AAC.19